MKTIECPYPALFDETTLKCDAYHKVTCEPNQIVPKSQCKYCFQIPKPLHILIYRDNNCITYILFSLNEYHISNFFFPIFYIYIRPLSSVQNKLRFILHEPHDLSLPMSGRSLGKKQVLLCNYCFMYVPIPYHKVQPLLICPVLSPKL